MVGIVSKYRIKLRSMQVHIGGEIDVVSITSMKLVPYERHINQQE